ncbi:MAG: aspartyl/asparaginyl beta-hydroxylase domain-containing protein [Gammaproteobacteria bacterium]|nr:aspartyl/asparaginyl beta-hydroxylase domain-containing protein [Gammaproteobacteria bacterium]
MSASISNLPGRALVRFGRRIRKPLDNVLAPHSAVGDPPVFARDTFPEVRALEGHWQTIRDEARAVMEDQDLTPPLRELSPDHRGIARDDHWRCFFIWGYGIRVEQNAALCPRTAERVERIPGLISAFFSIHKPGTEIPEHRGVSKSIINCHLPLDVPAGPEVCGIRIDGRDYGWQEGRTLIFDDTYRHSAWNRSDQPRVILLLQFRRPLHFPGSLLAGAFLGLVRHSPFVRDVQRALEAETQRTAR